MQFDLWYSLPINHESLLLIAAYPNNRVSWTRQRLLCALIDAGVNLKRNAGSDFKPQRAHRTQTE